MKTENSQPVPQWAVEAAKRKIYVASSWRNPHQSAVVSALRGEGHEVYDFKNPRPGDKGFAWSEIDPNWMNWTADQYISALNHPIAQAGFQSDFDAMKWADTFLLVLPCGRSAHLELGWACGQGKQTLLLTQDGQEPELMAKMCDHVCSDIEQVLQILRHLPQAPAVSDTERAKRVIDLLHVIATEQADGLPKGNSGSGSPLASPSAEVEQLQSVIGATRELSISAMDDVRVAAGAPKSRDDKSPKRAVDYVAALRARLTLAEQDADALAGVAQALTVAEETRRATVEERRWLTGLAATAREALAAHHAREKQP